MSEISGVLEYIFSNHSPKILVIGDVMCDKYIYGTVSRISPEAPVPILNQEKQIFKLGGAANVAYNCRKLGAEIYLIGFIGKEPKNETEQLKTYLEKENINFLGLEVPDYLTITKTRIISGSQQLLRIDYENVFSPALTQEHEEQLTEFFNKISLLDVVIVSDYGKGIISKNFIHFIKQFLDNYLDLKIIIDPKPINYDLYRHFADRSLALIKPNLSEAYEIYKYITRTENDSLHVIVSELYKYYTCPILVTRGQDGMLLLDGDKFTNFSAYAQDVSDVTGAGDTVISMIGVLLPYLPLKRACFVANVAASIAVKHVGCYAVTLEDLMEAEDLLEGGKNA